LIRSRLPAPIRALSIKGGRARALSIKTAAALGLAAIAVGTVLTAAPAGASVANGPDNSYDWLGDLLQARTSAPVLASPGGGSVLNHTKTGERLTCDVHGNPTVVTSKNAGVVDGRLLCSLAANTSATAKLNGWVSLKSLRNATRSGGFGPFYEVMKATTPLRQRAGSQYRIVAMEHAKDLVQCNPAVTAGRRLCLDEDSLIVGWVWSGDLKPNTGL
jgi:hypothetical protein